MKLPIALSRSLMAALAVSALFASCSTRAVPPPTRGAAQPDPTAATQPLHVSMPGELNAMPSLAALGDRVVLVWTGTRDGVMSVYSAVSDDRGATFNIQRRVNDRMGDVSANVEQPPRVAISSAGITVIWSAKKAGSTGIRMARSTDGGRTFTPATTVHEASLTGARGWESIAAAADGSVHVVWLDGRNATPMDHSMPMDHSKMDHSKMTTSAERPPIRQDVFAASIDPKGTVTEAAVASGTCFCCKTAVAVGSRGQVFAAWRHIFPGSLRDIAMAVSTDGGTFGPLARVSEDKWEISGCPEDGPSLTLDATDTAHVVWPTVVTDGEPQKVVFYASTKDGRTFTPRRRLSGLEQKEADHPQIAAGSSAVAAVWDEPHGDTRQVMFTTLGIDGQWERARALNTTGSASHPVVVRVGDGFLVGWVGGEGLSSAIALQRIGVTPVAATPIEHRAHAFRGKVESVDVKARSISVSGENVEGWMAAMTMVFNADKDDVIDTLKAGDQITATVYDGDYRTLHGVRPVR
jgi:Cu/Ag efflux protein CusF